MKKTKPNELAKQLNIRPVRAVEAQMKAKIITAVRLASKRRGFTHGELAERSGIPRSAVTGILSGSLQKITLDRVLRLLEAAELTAEIRIRSVA